MPDSVAPWAVGDEQRPELLRWFMECPFEEPENLSALRVLTGHMYRRTSDAALIGQYDELRRRLWIARELWVKALAERNRPQRELYATLAWKKFKKERAQATREVKLHMDVVGRASGVDWPRFDERPAPEYAASSLAGELGIAFYDELLKARIGGFCKKCKRPWLSRLNKPRQLCGRKECARAWRNEHRTAEDPAKVYVRVKRYRIRMRAKKKGGRQ